ncbi:MAG TPA: NAD(P)-binding domain-containing protein [Bdellovibrionota bacterium]|jgi:predicted dinucleotide-binding enzyme|nr:NAD(P)-binding domain-containing protein [Bdellovibrionota bacterium]
MKVGVLGSGIVGETLANGFLKHGYEVMRGSREPGKLAEWKSKGGSKASTGTFADAAKFGQIVVLSVKGGAAESVLNLAGLENLEGKTVIDTTNPIADKPPVNGVLQFFSEINSSLMEKLQKAAPEAHLVKAFSCVGNAFMVNPNFPGGKPSMFICGNDAKAKSQVSEVLGQFGWETEDMGAIEAARAIEPLCMLWCIPGIAKQQWTHAFKLLKQ